MKHVVLVLFFLLSTNLFAQKPCDYFENISDSIGTLKTTKDYMMYEKVFAGNTHYIFFSLSLSNGTPLLNVTFIQKSKGFMKANCFDKNSKLYLQLNNGKIITLLHTNKEDCGSLLRDANGYDNRMLTASFLFMKGSIEDLKSAPVNLMRIKYLTDIQDYAVKKDFISEFDNKTYEPDSYFINNIHCIEN